ncbi:MAG: tyrosine-type recombinase/integrase [Azospirillum sp.]|nr:tyrosine-type recombinase/integrase [Azospirillum sp.]
MPTPGDAASAWLDRLATERLTSDHTLAAYRRDLAGFLDDLAERLGRPGAVADLAVLTAAELSELCRGRSRAPASVARRLSTLRGFFRFLAAEGVADNRAIHSLSTPRPEPPPPGLAPPAASGAVATVPQLSDEPWIAARDAALFALIYGSGLRLGEVLALNRDAVPLGETLEIAGRDGRVRRVPVLPAARTGVEAYLAACPFALGAGDGLFVGSRGRRLSPGVVQRQMRRLRAALDLPAGTTPHALRRSFALRLRAEGSGWDTVQALLGLAHRSTARRGYGDAGCERPAGFSFGTGDPVLRGPVKKSGTT